MKIAICDDCPGDIDKLKRLITQSRCCPDQIEYHEFHSGSELLESDILFDAVFLDIQMESMDGSIVGEKLRARDENVTILFYTGYDMNASRIFKCRPQGYLMKEADQEELRLNLDAVLDELCDKTARKLAVACDGKAFVLRLSDILYISILNKGTRIWIVEEAARRLKIPDDGYDHAGIQSPVKLDAYHKQLGKYGFIYGSKSYIINASHVEMRKKNVVQLSDGTQLTLSRSRKSQFDEEFGRYWSIRYKRERLE